MRLASLGAVSGGLLHLLLNPHCVGPKKNTGQGPDGVRAGVRPRERALLLLQQKERGQFVGEAQGERANELLGRRECEPLLN